MHAPSPPTVSSVRPALFAVLVCAFYVAALLPLLAHHRFDTSVLITAGAEFVDGARVPSPIAIRSKYGYDGQFYYRLAVDPFSLAKDDHGVHIDNVPWRAQRILYPVLAHVVALGRAAWVPTAMLLVNLAALAGIGLCAARIARRLGLGWSLPVAIALSPGLIVALGRDTTEIVAAAFLLAALDGYLARKPVWFALFAAAAILTRETTSLFVLGVVAFEALQVLRRRAPVRDAIVCALALVPGQIWRFVVEKVSQQSLIGTQLYNMDWPLFGYAKALVGAQDRSFFAMFTTAGLLCMLAWIALVGFRIVKTREISGLVFGWLILAFGMLCLAYRTGALIEPIAFLRGFTECFIVGAIILATSQWWRPAAIIPVVAVLWYGAWQNVLGSNW